jgi:hypothetical protein
LCTTMSALWRVLLKVKNYTANFQNFPVLIAANHDLSSRKTI